MEEQHRVCKNFTRHDKKTRTILLCEMLEYTNVFLEAAFRAEGYSFETLKNPVKDRTLALRYISNDYCYPTVLILAQFLEYLESGERDPGEIALWSRRRVVPAEPGISTICSRECCTAWRSRGRRSMRRSP